jgi:hypothetical protein
MRRVAGCHFVLRLDVQSNTRFEKIEDSIANSLSHTAVLDAR